MPFPFFSICWDFTWTLRPSSRYLGSLKVLWIAAPGDSFQILGILCNSININCYNLKSQLSLYVYISYILQPTVPLSGPSLIYLFLVALIWTPYVKDQLKCLSSHCSDFLHCSLLTYFSFCNFISIILVHYLFLLLPCSKYQKSLHLLPNVYEITL